MSVTVDSLLRCNFSVQVIDFLFDLVDALRNDEYSLTDYEASILIPCLVEKVYGSSNFQYHVGFSLKLMLIYFFVFSVIDGNGMYSTLMVTSCFHCPN